MNKSEIKSFFSKEKNTNDNKKNIAEYTYIRKDKDGNKKIIKFKSKYVSTIDIPYGKYVLK